MRVRRPAVVLLAALAVLTGASCSSAKNAASSPSTTAAITTTTARVTSSACTAAKPPPAGQSTAHVTFGGVNRDYVLYVPRSYTGTFAVPVVFNFHGFGSNASQQMAYGDFRPLAEKNAFLIVAPDGEDAPIGRHFNVAQLPGQPDDVGFTLSILDSLEKDFCVDARRVYSAGMSDGGAMTSLLACVASNRFAAFGPVAVVLYNPACSGARSVPIAAFMGNADPVVPFNGGQVNCCDHSTVPAAPASMAGWASHDGCSSQPQDKSPTTEVTLRQWTGCRPPGDVLFYIVNGGGHTWPGSIDVGFLGKTTHQINASDTLWAFFQAHPLP